MKISFVLATGLGVASAFSPSAVQRQSTALNMDRREVLGQFGVSAAVLAGIPAVASADGAVSSASIQRARGQYGSRIADLKDAVASGDFSAVADEKNAFVLFNSGAYPKDKVKKNAAIDGTNAIFAAIRSGDKGALQSAYDSYVAANAITPLPDIDSSYGQGFSSDYDYRRGTSAGSIYVR